MAKVDFCMGEKRLSTLVKVEENGEMDEPKLDRAENQSAAMRCVEREASIFFFSNLRDLKYKSCFFRGLPVTEKEIYG